MLQSDKEKGLHPESGHNKETVEKSEILPNPDTGMWDHPHSHYASCY